MKNVPNRMFMECFKVLTKVAKKDCCHGYQVTKDNKIVKEYFRQFHVFYFSENRIRTSQKERYDILSNLFMFMHI